LVFPVNVTKTAKFRNELFVLGDEILFKNFFKFSFAGMDKLLNINRKLVFEFVLRKIMFSAESVGLLNDFFALIRTDDDTM
jgi:hypothetical protein